MRPPTSTTILGALAVASLLAGAASQPAIAGDKQAKPDKTLKAAIKELKKLKSYRVDFTVTGGTARGPQHSLVEQRVNQSWSETVYGKLSTLNGGSAYRLRRGGPDGAIKAGPHWKKLLAIGEGRLISRLFKRADEHLADAYKARKLAQWGAPKREGKKQEFNLGGPVRPQASAPAGGTRLKTPKQDKSQSAELPKEQPQSNVIVVEAPAQLAVRNFNQIITSGCFSEG